MPSPALIVLLPANISPNQLKPNASDSILWNSSYFSFTAFLIVLLTPVISEPDSSTDLTIFIISFTYPFKIINIVLSDPNIFLWIAASGAAAAAFNPNCIKTLLANGLSEFPSKDNPVFSNVPKTLPENPSDCPNLCNWVFDNFLLADEPFIKALRSFETCVLVYVESYSHY